MTETTEPNYPGYLRDLSACTNPDTASMRAGWAVSSAVSVAGSDGEFWRVGAGDVLRACLLAAALTGSDAATVRQWAVSADWRTPLGILRDHAEQVPVGWAEPVEHWGTEGVTPTTIRVIVAQAMTR